MNEFIIYQKCSHGGQRIKQIGETVKWCLIKNKDHIYTLDQKTTNDLFLAKKWSNHDEWSFCFWMGILSGFPLEDIIFYVDCWHHNLSNFIKHEYFLKHDEYHYVISPESMEREVRKYKFNKENKVL